MTPETTAVGTIKNDATASLTWIQKHERILIVALVLGAGSWFGNHWLNVKAANDKQTAAVAVQQLNDQKAANAQLNTQVSQLNAQYQQTIAQLSAQNAQLSAVMASRATVLQQQQATDKTLPLPELGNRWATLASISPSDISATPTGISVTDTGARQTVEQLEQVPVLTANVKDEQTVADNRQQELDKANGLISGLNLQVDGLKKQNADADSACKAEIKSVKADAAKSKVKWFKTGFVTGFISGLFIGHHI